MADPCGKLAAESPPVVATGTEGTELSAQEKMQRLCGPPSIKRELERKGPSLWSWAVP